MVLPVILVAAALGAAPHDPSAQTLKTTEAAPAAAASEAQAHIDAGLKAYKRRRFAQAAAELQKAVEADPSSAAAHFYLGYAYYKMGEPSLRMNENKEKAKAEFAKAFELDPTFTPVWGTKR